LAGFIIATINVPNIISGDFYVKFHLKNKSNGFDWALAVVYGAAQDANKPIVLAELVRIYEWETLPVLVGGDFNSIRRQEEKITIISILDGLLFLMGLLRVLI
jgi:hypothetical protein